MKSSTNRNLTLSLPAELIRKAKTIAARRATSLNAFVRESVERRLLSEDEYDAAAERLLEASETMKAMYGKGLLTVSKRKTVRADLHRR